MNSSPYLPISTGQGGDSQNKPLGRSPSAHKIGMSCLQTFFSRFFKTHLRTCRVIIQLCQQPLSGIFLRSRQTDRVYTSNRREKCQKRGKMMQRKFLLSPNVLSPANISLEQYPWGTCNKCELVHMIFETCPQIGKYAISNIGKFHRKKEYIWCPWSSCPLNIRIST